MDRKKKLYLIGSITGCVLIFVWLLVAYVLLGDSDEFTTRDIILLVCFIVVEVLTLMISLVLAYKANGKSKEEIKAELKAEFTGKKEVPKTALEKRTKRRGTFLIIAAGVLAFGFETCGLFLEARTASMPHSTLVAAIIVCFALPVVLSIANLPLTKRYFAKFGDMQVAEKQQYFLAHRVEAAETAAQKLRLLKKLILISDLCAVFVGLLGAAAAVCIGALIDTDSGWTVIFWFFSGIYILAALSRIRFPLGNEYFEDDETYVDAEDFPELYRLASKAQAQLGCKGKVRISIQSDCSAGIAKIGDTYSVTLGAVLLNILSEEELYCILLHEFSHMLPISSAEDRQRFYSYWLSEDGNKQYFSELTSLPFSHLDAVYSFQFFLYDFAATLGREEAADRSMAQFADKKIAASALLKLNYYDLYEWEDEALDSECIYATKQPRKDVLRRSISRYKRRAAERKEAWNELTAAELPARNATHPTTIMRLKALGVTDIRALELESSEEYTRDAEKAVDFIDKLVYKNMLPVYTEKRKEYYLEPLELVEKWEADGRPLAAAEYAKVYTSLTTLGRMSEAEALCDRAIAELPEAATYFAIFAKGILMLHRFDPNGLNRIYRAMEYNSNYIDAGLEEIGKFCCLAGLEDELERYREKSMELLEVCEEFNKLSADDDLSTEHLPQELQDGLLEYIGSIGDKVQEVFLVRKTIADSCSASAVVVRLDDNVTIDEMDEFYSKLSDYLDACGNWKFSLFDYHGVSDIDFASIPDSRIFSK